MKYKISLTFNIILSASIVVMIFFIKPNNPENDYNFVEDHRTSYLEILKKVNPNDKKSIEFNNCMTSAVEKCSNTYIELKLLNNHVIDFCDDYISIDSQLRCKNAFNLEEALKNTSIDSCKKISDENLQNTCTIDVVSKQAIESKNPSACFTSLESNVTDLCIRNLIESIPPNSYLLNNLCNQVNEIVHKKICINAVSTFKNNVTSRDFLEKGVIDIPVSEVDTTSNKDLPFILN